MAQVQFTVRTSGSSTANVASYSTASYSFANDVVYLACLLGSDVVDPGPPAGIAGGGLTWTLVRTKRDDQNPPLARLWVWRGHAFAGAHAGTVTFSDFGGGSLNGAAWAIIELGNTPTVETIVPATVGMGMYAAYGPTERAYATSQAAALDYLEQQAYGTTGMVANKRFKFQRLYYGWNGGWTGTVQGDAGTNVFPDAPFTDCVAKGRTPVISIQSAAGLGLSVPIYPYSSFWDGTTGARDTQINRWADKLKATGVTIYLIYNHEQNIKTGYGTAAQFKLAWQHIHDQMKQRWADDSDFAAKIKWAYNPISFNFDDGAHLTSYYPGNTYVDVLACDGYNDYKSPTSNTWSEFADVFAAFKTWADTDHASKPVMICEFGTPEHDTFDETQGVYRYTHSATPPAFDTGTADDDMKATWLTDAKDYVEANWPQMIGMLYFHQGTDPDREWWVDSRAVSLDAWNAWVTDPYYSDTDVSGTIVRSLGAATSVVATQSITLAAPASANNAALGIFAVNANGDITVGSGFTQLAEVAYDTPSRTLMVEKKTNTTTVDAGFATNRQWVGIALEVAYQVVIGNAALTGTGSLVAAGFRFKKGAAALTGIGSMVVAGFVTAGHRNLVGTASLSGVGTSTSSGKRLRKGAGALTGAGTMLAAGVVIPGAGNQFIGTASLTGVGTLSANGVRLRKAAANLTALGSQTVAGTVTAAFSGPQYTAQLGIRYSELAEIMLGVSGALAHLSLTGAAALTAISSITASGTHISIGAAHLTGVGTMSGTGTKTGAAHLTGVGTLTASGFATVAPPPRIGAIDYGALSGSQRRAYLTALHRSHRIRVLVSVYDRNERYSERLDGAIVGGQVDCDATADITRTLSLTVADKDLKFLFDPLGPVYADKFLGVTYGVLVAPLGLWVDVPVFYGQVSRYSRNGHEVAIEAVGKESLMMPPVQQGAAPAPHTLDEVQEVILDDNPGSGTFQLHLAGHGNSNNIAHNASPGEMETGVESIPGVSNVRVDKDTFQNNPRWTITFLGNLAGEDVPKLEVDGSNLESSKKGSTVNVKVDGVTADYTQVSGYVKGVAAQYGETRFALDPSTARPIPPKFDIDPAKAKESGIWWYLGQLASSVGCDVFYDARGFLCLRQPLENTVVHEFSDIFTEPSVGFDSTETRNQFVVAGHDGKDTVRAVANLDASHPLSAQSLGRNGQPRVLSEELKIDANISIDAAAARAKRELDKRAREALDIAFDSLVVPHLELGDPCRLVSDTLDEIFTVDQFSVPLVATDPMSVGYLRQWNIKQATSHVRKRVKHHKQRHKKKGHH